MIELHATPRRWEHAHAMREIAAWAEAGEPLALIVGGALVAACFLAFNAVRILLYLPQLKTCLRDQHGCQTINLLTWGSWVVANTSSGMYMWMFLGDGWGLVRNLGNAAMCGATVCVAVIKRRSHAARQPAGRGRVPSH